MIFSGLIAFVALILAIVAFAQGNILRSRIENLENQHRASQPPVSEPSPKPAAIPPPLPKWLKDPHQPAPPPPVVRPAPKRVPEINWESFVGVKLFAWIGGLALFLGVVFFVKYAFENNLITPQMRIIASGLVGLTLIGLGVLPSLRRYRIPAQSLIATGIMICYADIYGAHSFYSLISLTTASVLMWLVTAMAVALGERTDSPWILWLGLIGGFLTPFLFHTGYQHTVALFGYIGILNCVIAAVSAIKRWPYFIFAAAVCTFIVEFAWAVDFFRVTNAETARVVFFIFQGLFFLISFALVRTNRSDQWTLAAAVVMGFAPLVAFFQEPWCRLETWDLGFFTLVLGAAGLIALAAIHREENDKSRTLAAVLGIALGLIFLGQWHWWATREMSEILGHPVLNPGGRLGIIAGWHLVIFVIFAMVPYVCGDKRTWPWMIAAIAGPCQFWFVYHCLTDSFDIAGTPVIPNGLKWVLPMVFTIPAAVGIFDLIRGQGVALSSGDSRLASQGAAVIAFISLIFPVQFHREWITLGWAIEGLGLVLLFQWLPNRRLRAAALIVLCAAFVRLAFNPAVLRYHPRSHTPILNWYLYVYGIAGLCLFASACWFGGSRERNYEQTGPPLLYTLSGIVLFLLLNIEIADYFSIGPTLTFSFAGNFARDMTYTISWSLTALLLLVLGMFKRIRPLRFVAVALLCLALAKLFLHDLDSLSQLYRIAAFITVAIIAIVASFAYQRFLSPVTRQ
jgi:uncharacterized membrane protein